MPHRRKKIILGTRGSALALAQSRAWAATLSDRHPEIDIEFQKIITSGDQIQDRFLNEVGGKGLFVKEIEEALLKGKIDLAVHSLKDLPVHLPNGLAITCYPKRLDYLDVLVTNDGVSLDKLPEAAVIGTTSLRRRALIGCLRPDIKFEMLRGNIDTRMRRLKAGDFAAIVLAKAGMKRLGLDFKHAVDLPIIPSPGQGCLAIEARSHDEELKKILHCLHDSITEIEVVAERAVMERLGGDCNLPLGALAQIKDQRFTLTAIVASPDGKRWVEETIEGAVADSVGLAEQLALKMLERGGKEIVEEAKGIALC